MDGIKIDCIKLDFGNICRICADTTHGDADEAATAFINHLLPIFNNDDDNHLLVNHIESYLPIKVK